MNPAGNINNLFKKSKITVAPELDQKILNKAAAALPRQAASPARSTWSIVMQSPITKPLAAAILVIAGFLSLTWVDKTVPPAYALEQACEAMNNAMWMHAVVSGYRPNEPDRESWTSLSLGIEASRDEKGVVRFINTRNAEIAVYDPNANTITHAAGDRSNFYDAGSFTELINMIIQQVNKVENAQMSSESGYLGSKKVKTYEIKIPKGDPPGSSCTEIWRFTVDEKNHLLRRMECGGWEKTAPYTKVIEAWIDYPKTGPIDIYDLGVPPDADVIDKRPSKEVKAFIENYENSISTIAKFFTAIEVFYRDNEDDCLIGTEATVWYADGEYLRKEDLFSGRAWKLKQQENKTHLSAEMRESFESIWLWWKNPKNALCRSIELYDGKHCYRLAYDYGADQFQKPQKSTYWKRTPMSRFLFEDWAEVAHFMTLNESEPAIVLVENEYAKQHGLICLQKLYHESGGTPHGRFYKRLCYLDPNKSYLCCRFESYLIQDALWLDQYKDAEKYYVSDLDRTLGFTQRQIKEVTQFGQTDSGQWYPKEIQKRYTTQFKDSGIKESVGVVKIYLDTERPFPDRIFEPETLANYSMSE